MFSQTSPDECPYVTVSIYSWEINALLDSGANRIFANEYTSNVLLNLGVKFHKLSNFNCTVANSDLLECTGYLTVPIQLKHKIKVFDIYIVPRLRHGLVLGTVFWVKMGIVPDLRRGEWNFSNDSEQIHINMLQTADDLSLEDRYELNKVVENYLESIKTVKLGCTDLVHHKIVTNSPSIKSRYYPVSPFMQKKIDDEVTKMLELGVIERSDSSWSSPILMVPKENGEYRFCVDFRKLNAVTEKSAYPLPYMSSILDKLGNSKYLSSLDIKSAYWQICMEPDSKKYTAFTIPGRGLFHFTRMPFGLTNAPGTFQALVDKLFGPELEPFLFKYLDDIIISTPDFDTHLRILNEVFKRLKDAGLTLNKEKCKFCVSELKFLGYIVNRNGLQVDPEKVSAIVNMPRPKTTKEIRRLVGMVSWYRKFLLNLSHILQPLTALTKKKTKFIWTSECEQAFQNVKDLLISAPILSCPNFNYEFILQCDSSSYGLGSVLTQFYDGREHVICYLSRALTKNESKFTVTELELLSVLWSIQKLRGYLEGSEFTVITDHHSLIWLNNLKNPHGRLARWAVQLQQYNFKIIHRPGRHHVVPDCLSRAIPNVNVDISNIDITKNITDKWYEKMCVKVRENPLHYCNWRVTDDNKLYKHLRSKDSNSGTNGWKLVVPKSGRPVILKTFHDDPKTGGHLGIYKTYHRILNNYFWPGMKADIGKYINNCRICKEHKPEQKKKAGEMGSKPSITKCWQYIGTDIIGPLPRSTKGFQYILVICDYFSKFILTFPLRTATASAVTKLVEETFLLFGVPEFIRSDNGVQYKSREFKKLLEEYNVKPLTNPLYHPEVNFTERFNRVIKNMISCYIKDNHKKWDEHLAKLTCAYRTSKSEVTEHTPYYINFGSEMITDGSEYEFERQRMKCVRDPSVRVNADSDVQHKVTELQGLRQFVKTRLAQAHEKAKHDYNLRHRPVKYNVGDLVWKREYSLSDASKNFSAKLGKKFTGPYKIKQKLGISVYELEDENHVSKGIWHTKDLKPDNSNEVDFVV